MPIRLLVVNGQAAPEGHVFISYRREDSAKVDWLQATLERAGIRVWRDKAELLPGDDWRRTIRRAVTDGTLVFLACFSAASLARMRSWQNEELNLAIEQLRQRNPDEPWLIPVRFDDCDIPDIDVGAGRTLGSIQRSDLFGGDVDVQAGRLVAAVTRILGALGAGLHATGSDTATPDERSAPRAVLSHALGPVAGIAAAQAADAEPASEAAGAVAAQATGADHRRAMLVVRDAERIARSITYERSKAMALTEVAQAIVAANPDRASRLIDDAVRAARSYQPPPPRERAVPRVFTVADVDPKGTFLAGIVPDIAKAAATWNPDQAELLVESLRHGDRDKGRAVVAQAVAASDPERAERIAASITARPLKALALAGIARERAAVNPQAAARLVDEARQLIDAISDSLSLSYRYWDVDEARAAIAEAIAAIDPGQAGQTLALINGESSISAVDELLASITGESRSPAAARVALVLARSDSDRAEELARSISGERRKAMALADLARALAGSDPRRAARLIEEAIRVADSVSGERWQFDQAAALARIAAVLAEWDPESAEAIARSISDDRQKATALAGIARAVATSAPDRAENLARSITVPAKKVSALAGVAGAWLDAWEPATGTG